VADVPVDDTEQRDDLGLFLVMLSHAAHVLALRANPHDIAFLPPSCGHESHARVRALAARWARAQALREGDAKLVPPPTAAPAYEDEAYRLRAIEQRGNGLICGVYS